MMPKLPKLQIVVWEDACAYASWQSPKECGTALIVSAGFLVYEDDKFITLAGSISPPETNNSISIPKGWDLSRITIPWPKRIVAKLNRWVHNKKK